MKIESLREVKNNFSEVIADLPKTGPVIVTRNGKSAALLIPINEDTDLESLVLSNSQRCSSRRYCNDRRIHGYEHSVVSELIRRIRVASGHPGQAAPTSGT